MARHRRHARVCWAETPTPWILESQLIASLTLPLNLDQNKDSGFHEQLRTPEPTSALRRDSSMYSRAEPIALPRTRNWLSMHFKRGQAGSGGAASDHRRPTMVGR